MNNVQYTELKAQPYLINRIFNKEERKLMVSLRSRCHSAKMNFQKLHKGDLKCLLGCNANEDQVHIFTQCQDIEISLRNTVPYEDIFKDIMVQKTAIETFLKVDKRRQLRLNPPGEISARTRAQQSFYRVLVPQIFLQRMYKIYKN